MTHQASSLTRRGFLAGSAAASVGPLMLAAPAYAAQLLRN